MSYPRRLRIQVVSFDRLTDNLKSVGVPLCVFACNVELDYFVDIVVYREADRRLAVNFEKSGVPSSLQPDVARKVKRHVRRLERSW